jgi:hypothetical protein
MPNIFHRQQASMGDEIGIGVRHMGRGLPSVPARLPGDHVLPIPQLDEARLSGRAYTDSRRNAILMLRTP